MANINDVCRVAGVSKATVSRVINGTGQVSQSTREKVEAVMRELNYRPSLVAQALATQSSNSIGLVISDFTGGYFGNLLKQASISADSMGKQLLFADGHNNADDELAAVHSLVEKKCNIIVLYSRKLSCEQIIALSRTIAIPLINVGRTLPEDAGYSITFDQADAVKKAGEHLLSLGHKKLTYIGPEPSTPTSRLRLAGFEHLLERHVDNGIEGNICQSSFGFEESYLAMKAHLDNQHPIGTAMITAADDIAMGCIKALNEAGIRVPQDVSMVSIDNEAFAPFMQPPLTTVDIPINAITERAMVVAKQLIETGTVPQSEIYQGELMIRDSATSLT